MLKIAGCFADVHDWPLVSLAVVVCMAASFGTITLLRRAGRSDSLLRLSWLAVAAFAGGFGIWATHFIAMLSFAPGIDSGYDLGLTILSLAFAIGMTGAGLAAAIGMRGAAASGLGGMIVGAGIAMTHFTGMAAYQSAAHVVWDRPMVLLSVLAGAGLGAAAIRTAVAGGSSRIVGPSLLLFAATLTLHFTGMAAVTLVPDPSLRIPGSVLATYWVGVAVAGASAVIVMLAFGALALDPYAQRAARRAREHLFNLVHTTLEGLMICRGSVVTSTNASFSGLVGAQAGSLAGSDLARFLPDETTRAGLAERRNERIETLLRTLDGTFIPVEIVVRPMEGAEASQWAIAVRDLRPQRDAESKIHYLAHHDSLTGLGNRTSFLQSLEREIRVAGATGRKVAVLRIDLDRFKDVNDLLGHEAGDQLLKLVARLVSASLAEHEVMARLDGNEFAVLSLCDNAGEAGRLAERIIATIRHAKEDTEIRASVGIAIYPDDAVEHGALASCADNALRQAKRKGGGSYCFFEPEMGADVRSRRRMEQQLRMAIRHGEFTLAYQPQLHVETGRVTAFEALLRWQHPEYGAVPPDVFIRIAEETDLILSIGEWVMEQACREAAGWRSPLAIAVNVSTVQLHNPDFVRRLGEILDETGLAPTRLEIEITETALIRDPMRALAALQQIKALGVSIVMDDFGTGYSSLSNLRSFPFDTIKIDRSFVTAADRNDQTAAIVRSVLGLGRGLGMRVVAEGVETEEELDFLRREACHSAQGYLIGRPTTIDRYGHHTGGRAAEIEPLSLAS